MSKHEQKIKEGAKPFLEEGEEILAAFVARPRGWTQAAAGSANLGALQQGRVELGDLTVAYTAATYPTWAVLNLPGLVDDTRLIAPAARRPARRPTIE